MGHSRSASVFSKLFAVVYFAVVCAPARADSNSCPDVNISQVYNRVNDEIAAEKKKLEQFENYKSQLARPHDGAAHRRDVGHVLGVAGAGLAIIGLVAATGGLAVPAAGGTAAAGTAAAGSTAAGTVAAGTTAATVETAAVATTAEGAAVGGAVGGAALKAGTLAFDKAQIWSALENGVTELDKDAVGFLSSSKIVGTGGRILIRFVGASGVIGATSFHFLNDGKLPEALTASTKQKLDMNSEENMVYSDQLNSNVDIFLAKIANIRANIGTQYIKYSKQVNWAMFSGLKPREANLASNIVTLGDAEVNRVELLQSKVEAEIELYKYTINTLSAFRKFLVGTSLVCSQSVVKAQLKTAPLKVPAAPDQDAPTPTH